MTVTGISIMWLCTQTLSTQTNVCVCFLSKRKTHSTCSLSATIYSKKTINVVMDLYLNLHRNICIRCHICYSQEKWVNRFALFACVRMCVCITKLTLAHQYTHAMISLWSVQHGYSPNPTKNNRIFEINKLIREKQNQHSCKFQFKRFFPSLLR